MRKTRQEKFRDLCWDTAEALAQAAVEGKTEIDVVNLFRAMKSPPSTKGDVFWKLDNESGHFRVDDGMRWHSLLRRTRNHPVHGPAMFATFRSE